jgi:hypothetical protein
MVNARREAPWLQTNDLGSTHSYVIPSTPSIQTIAPSGRFAAVATCLPSGLKKSWSGRPPVGSLPKEVSV